VCLAANNNNNDDDDDDDQNKNFIELIKVLHENLT